MLVNVCVLGSGSKGNCTAVWTENTILLIDAGRLAVRYIKASLAGAGLSVSRVDGVLVTHSHTDHLSDTTYRLCGREAIPVYCSSATWESALRRHSNRRLEELERLRLLRELPDRKFRVGDFVVKTFGVSHSYRGSAGTPVGYTLCANGLKVVYATDLGHVTPTVIRELAGADILVIESNHDVQMELDSDRPAYTIDWVLSDTGHLSNRQCASALREIIGQGERPPRHVVLAHLSEDCNLPGLALSVSEAALKSAGRARINLTTAAQRRPTPVLSVSR